MKIFFLIHLSLILGINTSLAKTLNICVAKPIHNKNFLYLKVYEPLVKHFGKAQTLIPLIAKKWTKSADELSYTFSLREDIQFHSHKYFKPSRALNSSDVKLSLEQSSLFGSVIKTIHITNPLELKITLHKKDDDFIKKLASNNTTIKSHELYTAIQNTSNPKMKMILQKLHIGTGPFILQNTSESSFEFNAFNDYYLGKIQFKNLVLNYILGDTKRTEMLEHGQCHIVYNADLKTAETLPSNKFEIQKMRSSKSLYLGINNQRPALKDKELQLALLKSMDLDKWNRELFYSRAISKNYEGDTMSIKDILHALKIKKLPNYKIGSYIFSASWCPYCKDIASNIRNTLSQKLGTNLVIDRFPITLSVNPIKLNAFDFILTSNEKTINFDSYKLFEINKILVIDRTVKNFFYTKGQDADYSTIEFKPGAF